MQLIRAGVDSLYLAIKGTLPAGVLSQLANAKAQASESRREAGVVLADTDTGIRAMVPATGHPGGYAFVFDTGPLGARFACRERSNRPDWNLFVKPHAAAFLALGFETVVHKLTDILHSVGASLIEVSINRIDYAMDIRADDFVLDLDRFIAHPRATRRAHYSKADTFYPSPVLRGRRLESVTIGKMTGKQVILYDKTEEARTKRLPYLFEAWKIDPRDRQALIWRLELRLGRRELKLARRIRNFDELRTGLRPALCDLMQEVRYIAAGEKDSNVSRRQPDPIWHLGRQHIEAADLLGGTGDLPADQFIAITRSMKIDCYNNLILGNAAGLAATMELDDKVIEENLQEIVGGMIGKAAATERFRRSIARHRASSDLMFGGLYQSGTRSSG